MHRRIGWRKGTLAGLLAAGLLASACQGQRASTSPAEPAPPRVSRIVVFGFQPALAAGEAARTVRNPLAGTTALAEPVTERVADGLTRRLFEKMEARKDLDLIPPERAQGVFLSLVRADSELQSRFPELLAEVGRRFEAEAVLAGHVYRWRERRGKEYGVDQPASVAFDLHLIHAADGAGIWRHRFDKTQQSLVENLFDFKTFFQSGGRWLNASELADLGLDRALAAMPAGKGGE